MGWKTPFTASVSVVLWFCEALLKKSPNRGTVISVSRKKALYWKIWWNWLVACCTISSKINVTPKGVKKDCCQLQHSVMKFDRSNKFDFCYYRQVNSLRLKSSVASKWAINTLGGIIYFAANSTRLESHFKFISAQVLLKKNNLIHWQDVWKNVYILGVFSSQSQCMKQGYNICIYLFEWVNFSILHTIDIVCSVYSNLCSYINSENVRSIPLYIVIAQKFQWIEHRIACNSFSCAVWTNIFSSYSMASKAFKCFSIFSKPRTWMQRKSVELEQKFPFV